METSQSVTVLVFFHLLSCKFSRMFLFLLSKINLLIFLTSFFAWLISSIVGLFWKSSLWSSSDMKQLFSPFVRLLFKALLLCKTCFPAGMVFFWMLLLVFLYVAVIELFSILSYLSLVKP